MQIDLESYFRGFGEIDSIRLRRTPTGLFKGSVFVQFKNLENAQKYLSEPREWNGALLEVRTRAAWMQSKKEEDANLTPEERIKRQAEREAEGRYQKHFSAFKEIEKQEKEAARKSNRKEQRGRRGRNGKPRDRSRSPPPVEEDGFSGKGDVKVTPAKRPLEAVEPAPSVFSNKREKLDETQNGKRSAEEDLHGDTKKAKAD